MRWSHQQQFFFYFHRHEQLLSFERTQYLSMVNKPSIKDWEVSNSGNYSDSKQKRLKTSHPFCSSPHGASSSAKARRKELS